MSRKKPPALDSSSVLSRITRPLSLVAQVEQILRQAITEGRLQGGRLPTEVELADQLGVSRETVRRAAEVLQREGLLVKIRRKGTFTQPPRLSLDFKPAESTLLGYLQADYHSAGGQEEAVNRSISGLMLQGAMEEAGKAGFELVAHRAPHTQIGQAFRRLVKNVRLMGVIFASYGEEKLLRQVTGLGLPTVLLDHDLHLPNISSVRDDSFEGARQAVHYLANLGHRHIAFAHWHRTDLNPWRVMGYRQGLRDQKVPRRRVWELQAELTEAGARQIVEALQKLSPAPTALLCFNNTLARLVIEELRRGGVQVPEDLSVMGGGGEEVPGLTCYQADWYGMGRLAVQVLLRTASDKPTAEHHLQSHALRQGQTTGTAATDR